VDARVSAPWAAPAPSGSRSPAVDNQGHGPQFRCDPHADDNAPSPPNSSAKRSSARELCSRRRKFYRVLHNYRNQTEFDR